MLLPRFQAKPIPPRKPQAKPKECPSGKRGYGSQSDALEALARVRVDRSASDDLRPPESRVYECDRCHEWHLTSDDSLHISDLAPVRLGDGESLEMYCRRLENRIKEQRAQILSLHVLGHGATNNRAARKRIAGMTVALARVTELWQQEVANRKALVEEIDRLRGRKRGWRVRRRLTKQ